uniref:Uncharacterized protein n=1 Tax=viral metagenome TaxID=1070528 RepID=A0A6M3L0R1_9ZZZZ
MKKETACKKYKINSKRSVTELLELILKELKNKNISTLNSVKNTSETNSIAKVDLNAINLNFKVLVTEKNINAVKRVFNAGMVLVDKEEDIEINEEVDLSFCFEGEFDKETITLAMLFNSDLMGKPLIQLSRE